MLEQIQAQARQAAAELLETAKLKEKDIFVVGCSSSEIGGERIGTHSSTELAQAVLGGIYPLLKEYGVFLAAQCCEHLNRAIILEKEAAEWYRLPVVNAVPQPKACLLYTSLQCGYAAPDFFYPSPGVGNGPVNF